MHQFDLVKFSLTPAADLRSVLIWAGDADVKSWGESESTNEAAGFIAHDLSDLPRPVFVPGICGTAGAAETGVILAGAQARVHYQLTVRQLRLIHTVRRQALTSYRERVRHKIEQIKMLSQV